MMIKQGVVLCLLALFVTCIPTDEALNKVAEYIEMLQKSGKHHTIFSLFGINRNTTEDALKETQAKLLRECYMIKKGVENRFGIDVNPTQAKMLVVNGYKILTEKPLREAYNWILDEAPADFMQIFTRNRKHEGRIAFFMPSLLVFCAVSLAFFVVFDVASTLLHRTSRKEKQKKQKKQKNGKESGKKDENSDGDKDEEKSRAKTIRDTMTYRGLSKLFSVFRRSKRNNEGKEVKQD